MTKALGGADEARMLSLAGSAERTSSHPVAAAIVGCAAARGSAVDLPVAACTSVPGNFYPLTVRALGLTSLQVDIPSCWG